MTSGKRSKAQRQQSTNRRSEVARLQERRRRGRRQAATAAVLVVVVGLIVAFVLLRSQGAPTTGAGVSTPSSLKLEPLSSLGALQPFPSSGTLGPEGVPVPAATPLASTATMGRGQTIDGIQCQASEQTVYHIHVHLTIFVDGVQRAIPIGVGIPGAQIQQTTQGPFVNGGSCLYWLHVHASDGIIHIESPVQRTYTLGEFFAIWGQPLSADQVGPNVGHVVVMFNGQRDVGNPRSVPLIAHAQIQLEVGTPLVAPEKIIFPPGL